MAKKVFSGLVTAWRFAGWPTRRSPSSVNATIDGVVRTPSEFSMTLGVAPSMTATQEFVVPRSMPITFDIFSYLSLRQTVPGLREHPLVPADTFGRYRFPWNEHGSLFVAYIGSRLRTCKQCSAKSRAGRANVAGRELARNTLPPRLTSPFHTADRDDHRPG